MAVRSFKEKLRDLRTEKGLTQKQLSEKLDISYTTIKDLESKPDACKNLRTETTLKIIRFFKCDLEYLFGDQEEPRAKIASAADATKLRYETIERIEDISEVPHYRIVLDTILSNPKMKDVVDSIYSSIAGQQPLIERAMSFDGFLSQAQSSMNSDIIPNFIQMIETYSSEYMVVPRKDGCIRYKQEASRIFTEIIEDTLTAASNDEMDRLLHTSSKDILHKRREEDGEHKEDSQ